MTRLPLRAVQLEDIISSNIIGDDPDTVALILKTHLALEAILIEMIEFIRPGEELPNSFPNKTVFLAKRQVISENDRQAYGLFNDFRNDTAHIFGHKVTSEAALKLASALEGLGVDFSDPLGSYNIETADEYFGGTSGIVAEIGWALLYHAAYSLSQIGGRNVFSASE